ncbi:hypothetical protein QMK17_18165 [Rhodococcus sp. G-MC3]|uniref:hypothetical protein n=1 Tax=Rhodococcus sp. G-MC3 TaxID=3046209 RepID=UPI0024BB5EA0|nr:hypothetical protein [Rhodococcus sp. G-MC3]MDJ0395255.1 hypothetical protein [Rhodococcus sp. G-MC3]
MNALVPGTVVAGKYRLLGRMRSVEWAQWWMARDLATAAEITLTFVPVDVIESKDRSTGAVRRYCDRTLALSSRNLPIRAVDVVRPYVVVAAGVPPPTTLEEFGPTSSAAAVQAVTHLVSVLRAVHRRGRTVALNHPTLVRVTDDSLAVLACPAVGFGSSTETELVGLGAVLHTMLVGYWPSAMDPAPPGRVGAVAAEARAGHYATLDEFEAALVDATTEHAPANRWTDTAGARTMSVALACAVLAVFGAGGWYLSTAVFGGDYGDINNVVAIPSLPAPTTTPPPVAVLPTGAEAWSAVRAPDNSDEAGRAVDADPATSWSTDRYRTPFAGSDDGIGVLVTFAEPVGVSEVWVTTAHPGTVVEVRTPPDADGTLDSTRILASGVLSLGATHIPVVTPETSRSLLIWVARLAPSGSQFASDFSEIGFTGR